jgi:RNA polymerase sigma-70 factor, ECF subfamily
MMKDLKQLTDQELINELQQGNETAGEEIYVRYYESITNFCGQYLHSPEDGQDVAQEVFMKVIMQKKIFGFRGESKLWSWLKRIATNDCNELFRKRKKMREFSYVNSDQYASLEEALPCKDLNPEEQVVLNEEKKQLHTVIEQLPNKYFNAVSNAYLEDRSYKETAKTLRKPVRAIGLHLWRAKDMIAKMIQEQFVRPREALIAFANRPANWRYRIAC